MRGTFCCRLRMAAAVLHERRALTAAARYNLVLVSGGAGVGKTHLAAAIHRLYNVVIVDEVSMVDIPLAWHLFRAIDLKRTCVVLIGDHNQLPPVGPGNLLRDLIERQPIPTIILNQVVRQAGVLKENSLAVLKGEVRCAAEKGEDGKRSWIVINHLSDVMETRQYILDLFNSILVEKLKFDLLVDVQLLTPTHKGPLGTNELNIELQRLIQKKLWNVNVSSVVTGYRPAFFVHDRVIQTRNNYRLGVMNGAIGIVSSVGPKPEDFSVRFDDVIVDYSLKCGNARDLSLAYALTVHKIQGDQIPCVIQVIHKSHSFMHHRNLFYTGVTRAQKIAIIVGDSWGIRNCAQKQEVDRRKTFLSLIDFPNNPTEAI